MTMFVIAWASISGYGPAPSCTQYSPNKIDYADANVRCTDHVDSVRCPERQRGHKVLKVFTQWPPYSECSTEAEGNTADPRSLSLARRRSQ